MTSYAPGDILLVNDYSGGSDLLGNLIRAGERCLYGGPASEALDGAGPTDWTHSALIISETGDLAEALAQGVVRSHISKYAGHTTKVIHIPADDRTRALIVAGALRDVGLEYNRVDFVSLAVQLLFGIDWAVNDGRADICSEFVSRYTEKAIPGYQAKPGNMMPGSIDVYFGAKHGGPLSMPQRWLALFQAIWWWARPWKHGLKTWA